MQSRQSFGLKVVEHWLYFIHTYYTRPLYDNCVGVFAVFYEKKNLFMYKSIQWRFDFCLVEIIVASLKPDFVPLNTSFWVDVSKHCWVWTQMAFGVIIDRFWGLPMRQHIISYSILHISQYFQASVFCLQCHIVPFFPPAKFD